MNLNKVTTKLNRLGLKVEKRSPEILLGVGIISGVAALALMYRQALVADEILDHHKKKMNDIEEAKKQAEEYPDEYEYDDDVMAFDKRKQMVKTTVDLGKAAAPVIALEALSVTCILVSRNILNKRYLGAVAAYNGLSEVFKQYRKRVLTEEGIEADRHYLYGTEYTKEQTTTVDENGKKKKELTTVEENTVVQNDPSITCRVFEEGNENWHSNPNYSMMFLRSQQNAWNDKLHTRGHVFLNEVLESLGFDHCPMGSIVGWIDNENGDGFIDFGLYDMNKDNVRRFINGKDNCILLEFNHDGIIYDKI